MKQVAKAVVGEPTSNAVHYLRLQASNEGQRVALGGVADCLNLDNLVQLYQQMAFRCRLSAWD